MIRAENGNVCIYINVCVYIYARVRVCVCELNQKACVQNNELVSSVC